MGKRVAGVNAELKAAFDVLRVKLQGVLDRSAAKDVEIKRLRAELKFALEEHPLDVIVLDAPLKGKR